MRTRLTHDQVRQRGAEQGLNISLFNDYLLRDGDGLSERTTKRFEQYSNGETALVLNYAGIEPERAVGNRASPGVRVPGVRIGSEKEVCRYG